VKIPAIGAITSSNAAMARLGCHVSWSIISRAATLDQRCAKGLAPEQQ
jgi:hypothetical protein